MADFQAQLAGLTEANVVVVAGSVDDRDAAQKMIDKEHLTFPVAYGMDALACAASLGCFYQAADPYLQPTGVIIAPDGTVSDSVYANGAVGRLTAADALALIAFRKKQLERAAATRSAAPRSG